LIQLQLRKTGEVVGIFRWVSTLVWGFLVDRNRRVVYFGDDYDCVYALEYLPTASESQQNTTTSSTKNNKNF
jgi:hypothetical protein